MAGTLVWFSGHTANAVVLRRSIGMEPDAGYVEIPVDAFPGHDTFRVPEPGFVHLPPAIPAPPPISVLNGTSPAQLGALVAEPFGHQGIAFLAESVPNADGSAIEQFEHTARHLYVTDVQRFVTGRKGGVVRVSFTDFRAFLDRGHMDRWRFGILDDAGEFEPDSLLDGKPPTLAGVARYVVSRFFGQPELAVVPASWESLEVSFLFDRWGSAKDALDLLLERYPARFVLHWDNTIGLYLEGDGRIGYTVGGEDSASSVNAVALPPWIQDMRGQGHVEATSYGYPSDYVIVGGAPTIASVAIDCWEPVLLIDGVPVPLREGLAELLGGERSLLGLDRAIEQTQAEISRVQDRGGNPRLAVARLAKLEDMRSQEQVRRLRDGAPKASDEDMAWLQRWVFRYEEFQGSEHLSAEAVKILKRDAYRLWRLPGADTFNRHLLPLLRRAETVNGVRQSITVETYRYTFRSGKLGLSGGEVTTLSTAGTQRNRLRVLRKNLSTLRRKIHTAANASLSQANVTLLNKDRSKAKARRGLKKILNDERLSAHEKALASEAFRRGQSLSEAALIAEGAGADELGKAYTQALKDRHAAEKVLNPSSDTLEQLDVYEKLRDLGRAIDADEAVLPGDAVDAIKRLSDDREQRYRDSVEGRTQAQGGGGDDLFEVAYGTNDPRSVDPSARLEDAELGLVRTAIAGWLEREAVPNAAATSLVPKAVRVIFGTSMRPPRDPQVPPENYEWCDTQPEDVYPPQLLDLQQRVRAQGSALSLGHIAQLELLGAYHIAFKRSGSSVERIEFELVPMGQASTEGHDELQELIALTGDSNRSELDRQAAEIAAAVVAERKSLTQSHRRHYLRPWRVNCDGVVDAVEISLRSGGRGFTTLVVTGGGDEPFGQANKTRVRRPAERRRPARRVEETRG